MGLKSKVGGLEAEVMGLRLEADSKLGPKLCRGRGSDVQSRDISSWKKVTALYEVNKVVYAT